MDSTALDRRLESAVGSKVRVLRGPYSGAVAVVAVEEDRGEYGCLYQLARITADGVYLSDDDFERVWFDTKDLWPCWMDDTMISVYRCSTDNVGAVCSLSQFLLSQRHRDKVMQMRALTDEHEQKEAKRYLPMATLSGTFSPKRKADCLVQHSGVMCIDIDSSPANVQRWGQKLTGIDSLLRTLPWVCYYAHSCRGVGYFCLVRVSIERTDDHAVLFRLLQQQFAVMGVEIDRACKDVSRPRFISCDESPYYTLSSEVLSVSAPAPSEASVDWHPSAEALAYQEGNAAHAAASTSRGRLTPEEWAIRKIELCVEEAEYRHQDVTGNYSECIMLGMSLYALGSKGFDLWCRLCALRSASHAQLRTKKELAVKWMSFRTANKMCAMQYTDDDQRMRAFFSIIKSYGIRYTDAIERQKSMRTRNFRN